VIALLVAAGIMVGMVGALDRARRDQKILDAAARVIAEDEKRRAERRSP